MRTFPFPDKKESKEELKRDILYRKIPEGDREKICDMAWQRGMRAARKILRQYPDQRIQDIAEKEGLKVCHVVNENVNTAFRTFGEYHVQGNYMILYQGSIEKWAKANSLTMSVAEEMVMAHEFYHFLECTKIGETSEMYHVPTLRLGKAVLLKSGVRALSEIGAHGFARTYFCSIYEERSNRTWNR